jgi:hypothetical protein
VEVAREGCMLQYRGATVPQGYSTASLQYCRYCSRGCCSRRRAARNWWLGFGALLNLPAP